jgi:FkbM family methyltransferase
MKEFIKKIPVVVALTEKLYHKLRKSSTAFQSRTDDWTLRVEKINTMYGTYFSWKGDGISQQLKEYSAHTRNELAMIKTLIATGDNILDIGAHIGTFSIPFSLFNKGQGSIYAFEANPENFNLLRINIVENGASACIIPHLAIVSNTSSSYKMFLPEQGNSGMYSFLPDSNGTIQNSNSTNIDVWYETHHKGAKIHFVKIDVEGAEVSALESCQKLIGEQKPILYIEINEFALALFHKGIEDVERLLRPYGYHFYRNAGARNSDNDLFEIKKLESLKEGGTFFDLLAIHPSSPRYPLLVS